MERWLYEPFTQIKQVKAWLDWVAVEEKDAGTDGESRLEDMTRQQTLEKHCFLSALHWRLPKVTSYFLVKFSGHFSVTYWAAAMYYIPGSCLQSFLWFCNNALSSFPPTSLAFSLQVPLPFRASQSSVLGSLLTPSPSNRILVYCFSYHLSICSGHPYFLHVQLRHILLASWPLQ